MKASKVYIVRQFFETCGDTSYLGVYRSFWGALKASKEDFERDYNEEPGYNFRAHHTDALAAGLADVCRTTELWCEVYDGKHPYGIYYTITEMELQE